jgi:hypothetical protein
MKRAGYQFLSDLAIPTGDPSWPFVRIGHLIAGPSGVFAVDSDTWDKRLPVHVKSHHKLLHGPFNKADRLKELKSAVDRLNTLLATQLDLDNRDVHIQAALAIHGPLVPWNVLRVLDVDVFADNRIRSYLQSGPRKLSDEQVTAVLATLAPLSRAPRR